ncbi:MAG: hypothetical protein H0X26_09440 [Alphaproteobacteria bacterium]|nr:hypothetical protein [Alphaproteobacteria bacterium]
MVKNFKIMSSTFLMAVTLVAPQLSYAMEPEFKDIPKDVWGICIKQAAYEQCLKEENPVTLNKTLGNLELVCEEWRYIINIEMKVNTPSWKAWYGVTPQG